MTDVKMPKPVGYFSCHPETLNPEWGEDCVCQDNMYCADETGTIGRPFIFTDQAEAYKNVCVREALEEAAKMLNENALQCQPTTAYILDSNAASIRAFMPEQESKP